MCMSSLCRCNNFSPCSILFSIRNIFCDRSCFQPGLLQNHSKVGPQTVSCNILNSSIADTDLSTLNIIKTHQKIDQRRLSASRRSYNRNFLTRLYLQVQILQKLNLRIIRKTDMFQCHTAVRIFQFDRRCRIRLFRLFLNKVKYPPCARQCILKLCDHT